MPLSVVSISKKRTRIQVKGIVQGVGFRPFVYKEALILSLKGFVLNGGNGVVIEVQGSSVAVDRLVHKLRHNAPPLSKVDSITITDITCQDEDSFSIKHSKHGKVKTMVSSDISMCNACKEEMHNPKNRRFQYPFINCTDCGPRYSIIENLPYDRVSTSMSKFSMCPKCKKEYEDPLQRRFHAQPISCYDCGPSLSLSDLNAKVICTNKEAIQASCDLLKEGKTIAIKGLGGFHIVCDASNEEAVVKLRSNKNRPTKPLAVMFKSLEKIKEVSRLTPEDIELIESKESPIVIVDKNKSSYLASRIAPNINRIGVFLPYTPLHEILLMNLDFPLVATSANLSEEPILVDEKAVLKNLSHVVCAVLTHDREIVNACDDSVYMRSDNSKILMRLARGFAPLNFALKEKSPYKILAVGANQKSTIALAFNDNIILSPHIGDLGSIVSFEYFERTLETFKRFYDFIPEVLVCDKHSSYETTKWAKNYVLENPNCELIEVQHHYAHAMACMAEHKLDEKVLAFCFDGTGYGDDATLWGGEVLLVDPLKYERVHYFRPLRLIGGEKAVKAPNRVALSLLFENYTLEEILEMKNECVQSFSLTEIKTFHLMYLKELNSPLSSSVGRLFDAVLSLSGIGQTLGYEGESGLLLECHAEQSKVKETFSYEINGNIIDCHAMINEILNEKDKNAIALKFISMLSSIIVNISEKYPDLKIVFSGGVFQNRLLVSMITNALKKRNRVYYIQEETPVNDGGIALGQVYHAYHVKKENNGK